MSGLVTFFHRRPRRNGDADPNLDSQYHQPLSLTLQQQQQQSPALEPVLPSCLARTEEPMGYRDWKEARRMLLQAYVDNRLLMPSQSDDDEEEEEGNCSRNGLNGGKNSPAKSINESQGNGTQTSMSTEPEFETQPSEVCAQQQKKQQASSAVNGTKHLDKKGTDKNEERGLIPHAAATLYDTYHIPDMDLLAKWLHLRICRITKRWPLRTMHRCKYATAAQQVLYTTTAPTMPRLALQHFQDDGPLAMVYKEIISMEVEEVEVDSSLGISQINGIRHRAEQMQDPAAHIGRRLPIFLYKTYAKAIDKIMESEKSSSSNWIVEWFISMHHVPAKCIFPYAAVDWYDRHDSSEYCLGLGDDSTMSVQNLDCDQFFVRFDDSQMQLFLCSVCRSNGSCNGSSSATTATHASSSGTKATIQVHSLQPSREQGVLVRNIPLEESPFAEHFRHLSISKSMSPNKKQKRSNSKSPVRKRTPTPQGQAVPVALFESKQPPPAAKAAAVAQAIPKPTTEVLPRSITDVTPEVIKLSAKSSAPQRPPSIPFGNGTRAVPADAVRENGIKRTVTASLAIETSTAGAVPPSDAPRESVGQKRQRDNVNADVAILPAVPQATPGPPLPNGEQLKYERIHDLRNVLSSHRSMAVPVTAGQGTFPHAAGACIIHLFGVVLGFSPPSKTKRGDWMMKIALVDDSIPLPSLPANDEHIHVVSMNIFTKTKDKLPKVRYAGDVLRMHRVKLQEWKGELQLMGMRPTSYVVFRGDVDRPPLTQEWTVLPTAENFSSLTELEQQRCKELWIWGQRRFLSHRSMRLAESFRLSDMLLPEHGNNNNHPSNNNNDKWRGDCTVMVTAIIPCVGLSGVTPCGFLRVWDGTGVPVSDAYPLPSEPNYPHPASQGDPPPEALSRIARTISILEVGRNPPMKPPKAVTGRVVNVAVWEVSHWELVRETLHVGSFIRLRNIREDRMPNGSFRCLMVVSESYLTPLPDMTFEVVHLLREHDQRLHRNDLLNPNSGLLPLEEDMVAPTVRESIQHPQTPPLQQQQQQQQQQLQHFTKDIPCHELSQLLADTISISFVGSVQVMDLIPSLNFLSSHLDSIVAQGEMFRFGVRLRDDAGVEIDGIAGDGIGEVLFGMPAGQALQNKAAALAHVDRARQCRWLVCLQSRQLQDVTYFVVESIETNEPYTTTTMIV